ncbi:MAG: lysophospholipid acyltransferase family protein [Desulfovibrio sp.]|nr:lysophospholipid acyltransferase family protein [Desulfovibrio sp.]
MNISPAVLAPCISLFYRLWCCTLRIAEEGREASDALEAAGKPMVIVLWHDEFFPMMYIRRTLKVVAIVSRSRDGEYLARLLEALGIRTARGSSSRDGLKALLRTARLMADQRYNGCITVDGPRGPRHVVKEGAIFLAMRSAAHIVPLRIFPERAKVFRSWDRFQLPLPFSRVRVLWGTPYLPDPGGITEMSLDRECRKLQAKMDSLT